MVPVSYKTAKILSPSDNNFIGKILLICSYQARFSFLLPLVTWLVRIAWTPHLVFSPPSVLIWPDRNEKFICLKPCHISGFCLNFILIILCQAPILLFILELLWRQAAVINWQVECRTDFTLKCGCIVLFCFVFLYKHPNISIYIHLCFFHSGVSGDGYRGGFSLP